MAVDTGLRKTTELLRLQIEHVNFRDSPVFFNINGKDVEVLPHHLLVAKNKNRRPRAIPMTARVRSELLQVVQGRTEGPVFSSARTGVSLVESMKMVRRYSRAMPEAIREAVQRLEQRAARCRDFVAGLKVTIRSPSGPKRKAGRVPAFPKRLTA